MFKLYAQNTIPYCIVTTDGYKLSAAEIWSNLNQKYTKYQMLRPLGEPLARKCSCTFSAGLSEHLYNTLG